MINGVSIDIWLATIVGLVFMQASPGPAVLTAVSYALEYERRHAFSLLCAFVIGQKTALLLGLTVVVSAFTNSPNTLFYLRSFGGFLLVLLGTKKCLDIILLEFSDDAENAKIEKPLFSALFFTWLIASTSPIALVFYITMLSTHAGLSIFDIKNITTLCFIVMTISILTGGIYIGVTSMAKYFFTSSLSKTIINILGHTVLIFIGIWAIFSAAGTYDS